MDWLLQLGDGNVGPVLVLARCGVAVCNCGIALGWLLEPGAYGILGPVLLARCGPGVTVAVCNCAIALGGLLEPGAYGHGGPVRILLARSGVTVAVGWLLQPGDGNVGPVLLVAVLEFVRFVVVETPGRGGVPVLSNGVFPYGTAPATAKALCMPSSSM